MSQARGPSGSAPLPPDDLHDRPLPITELPLLQEIYRVHRSAHNPIFFGPGGGRSPAFRFDSASRAFGVLYAAPHPHAALIETLLRNPARLMVDWAEINTRSMSMIAVSRDLRLVDARGPGLSRLGITAALTTGPYEPCGLWSDALYGHPEQPDGIIYASRHNQEEDCIALFERQDVDLQVFAIIPLIEMQKDVAELLDRHGKSIAGLP